MTLTQASKALFAFYIFHKQAGKCEGRDDSCVIGRKQSESKGRHSSVHMPEGNKQTDGHIATTGGRTQAVVLSLMARHVPDMQAGIAYYWQDTQAG